jgi:GT2 family glycosyltransferase
VKVSAVIVTYNRPEYLKRALLALNNQSYLVDEVIISDDGSKEELPDFIKKFASELQYVVKYVRQEDKGFRAAKARNNGIRATSGDYVIFIDQDVVFTENYIKKFIEKSGNDTFLVAYPVRLDKEQTNRLLENESSNIEFYKILKSKQIKKIHKQYIKDSFEYYLKRVLKNNSYKPKLRSGVFGVYRNLLIKTNGFDENYTGWGNEDDDLGRRLYQAGLIGRNVFYNEFPIHLYHEPNHDAGKRVNIDYYRKRKLEIANGDFKAVNGIENPIDGFIPEIKTLN